MPRRSERSGGGGAQRGVVASWSRKTSGWIAGVSLALATTLCTRVGDAQGDAPVMEPPMLERHAEATGVDSTIGGHVILELTVGADGRVSDVEVVESTDPTLEEPAARAAERFRFRPATRDGAPVAARIRYRFDFEAEAPEAPPSAPEPRKAPPPKTAPPTATEPESDFSGEVTIYGEFEDDVREPTRRTLRGEKLQRIPGTRGDALRAIEILPGVAQTTDGEPRLRGSASDESQVFFEGVPVPLLYHFGGLTSVFQSKLLERVDFYPGNFSVRYGRVSGGAIDVAIRDPREDRFHAMLDASLLDTSALVETPIGPNAGVAAAARRSNIDFFFERVAPDSISTVSAPVYWDYQGLATVRLHPRHTFRLVGYGARDSLRLFIEEPDDTDPALRGRAGGELEFHRLQLELESELSPDVTQQLQLTYGRTAANTVISGFNSDLSSDALYGRGEWRARLSRKVRFTMGFDVDVERVGGDYFGPRPGQNEGDPDAFEQRLASTRPVGVEETTTLISPAGYVELQFQPVEPLVVVPGIRFDYFEHIAAIAVDPRLGARYSVTEDTTLKSGVGLFTQRPVWWRSLPEIGNPDIEPHRALHLSTGVEQRFGDHAEIGVEGFYKRIIDRIVDSGDGEPYFINDGVGRVYGAEVSAEVSPTPRSFLYMAYTLSRSERRDGNGPWRLFDYDQTHNFSLAGNYELGRGWELGARFRVVTGSPETPVEGAVYDGTTGSYLPVHGRTNSRRMPTFHQLDVRAQKTWSFDAWSLAVYLDIMNAYNSKNPEGTDYSFDYSESQRFSGLPFFPNFGVRGEL